MGYGAPSAANGMKENIPEGYTKGSIQQYTPEQMQLHQQQFAHVDPNSYLAKLAGGDQSTFAEMEAPALRQFSELQGGMASRFSSFGGLGARKSSGFQNSANAAASNFAQQLQSQRQGIQRQAINDLMGFSNQILGQKPFENTLQEEALPWWQQGLIAGAQGFGEGAGKAAGTAVFA